jgi:hypothetical protein
LRVQATKPPARFEVTCDGDGIAGHAGSALLVQLADRLGLTTALGWRRRPYPTKRSKPNGRVRSNERRRSQQLASVDVAAQATARSNRAATLLYEATRTTTRQPFRSGAMPCYARVRGGCRGGDPSMACKGSGVHIPSAPPEQRRSVSSQIAKGPHDLRPLQVEALRRTRLGAHLVGGPMVPDRRLSVQGRVRRAACRPPPLGRELRSDLGTFISDHDTGGGD